MIGWIALADVCLAADTRGAERFPEVLVSRQLLNHAHLSIGDVITLAVDPSGARSARFRIAGVYEPTPDPMKFSAERNEVRLHLPDLTALASDPTDSQSTETVGAINIALVTPADTAKFIADLSGRTVGLTIRRTARQPGDGNPFEVLERFHIAIAAVTVVGSTAFLLALMVIRAEERRETVGILRLIGISRRSILLEVLVEGLIVAIAGAVFGVLVAAIAQHGVNRFFQARYDTALVFVSVTPSIAARAVATAVPVGVVAGFVASWTLLRRRTSALIRR